MAKNTSKLLTALDELERLTSAGAAAQPRQVADLDRALATLEQALRDHANDLRQPDELVGHLDRPRIPSPALDRYTGHLREELDAILADVRSLRARTQAGQSATPDAERGALIGRARELLHSLEKFENEEADVILETVNTDIGAGD